MNSPVGGGIEWKEEQNAKLPHHLYKLESLPGRISLEDYIFSTPEAIKVYYGMGKTFES